MSDQIDTRTAWLSPDLLASVRANVPLVYVDAIPVRVDESGRVTQVGLIGTNRGQQIWAKPRSSGIDLITHKTQFLRSAQLVGGKGL